MIKSLIKFSFVLLMSVGIAYAADIEEVVTVIENDTYNNDLIISDDWGDMYLINTTWGCYGPSYGEYVGLTSAAYWLGFTDEVYYLSGGELESCDVSDSNEITGRLYVHSVFDYDQAIVSDKHGSYLIEVGSGCSRLDNYEEKNIYIDKGGSFVDGIGDKIILPDGDGECRIWDAEDL
jgi:hypothetical protein